MYNVKKNNLKYDIIKEIDEIIYICGILSIPLNEIIYILNIKKSIFPPKCHFS